MSKNNFLFMNKSNLISLLATFSKNEAKDFKKWLQSLYHNQRSDIILMFDAIFDKNVLKSEEHIEKEKIYKKIFNNEKYDDAKMRQVMYFLLKSAESYLLYEYYHKDEIRNKIAISDIYKHRQLDRTFLKNIDEVEEELSNSELKNYTYWFHEYNIQSTRLSYYEKQAQKVAPSKKLLSALDYYYIASKLKQSCLILSWFSVSKHNFKLDLLEEILSYVRENQLTEIPAIGIYYYIYNTLIDLENEEHFYLLKEKISNTSHYFPLDEQKEIYLAAINYCIRRLNVGHTKFLNEVFDLYKSGFSKRIFVDNNRISRSTFQNAINIAGRLKQFDWAEKVIHDFQEYLDKDERDDLVNFSMALINYEKKDYKKALRLFSQVEYKSVLMNLVSRSYIIRMLYEQDEWGVLEAQLESVQNYLRRKEVIGYHKIPYKNYVKFTKKLMKSDIMSRSEKEKLKTEITESQNLPAKDWLLTQLAKIM